MNYKELVSVIIPVYNVERYLRKCVSSVISQTYTNLEIILIDDGSTDSSGKICDELQKTDKRINVIHQENKGLSYARNAGMNNCNGDYLLFVDSDDYIKDTMVELMIKAITELKVDVVECEYNRTNSDLEKFDFNKDTLEFTKHTNEEFLKYVLEWRFHYPMTWNKLYKASTFLKYSFREGKLNEDEFFINDWVLDIPYIGHVNRALYNYRMRKDSITRGPMSLSKLASIEAYVERYYIIKHNFPNLINNMLNVIGYQFLYKQHLIFKSGKDEKEINIMYSKLKDLIRPLYDELLNCNYLTKVQKDKIQSYFE